jgi:hypothetical protein
MLTRKTLVIVIATVATLSAQAADRQSNPLHPAYYAERTPVTFQYIPTEAYVDANNPLHPSYAKIKFNDAWISTAAVSGNVYVDSGNPLHPSYKRF